MSNRLKDKYKEIIIPSLMKDLKISNIMDVPRLLKVSINAGIGGFRDNRESVDAFFEDLTSLAGQKPYIRKATMSEAGFKVRKGDTVGLAVTLRGEKMWAFLDKFVSIVLPRFRDFRGLDLKAFDASGNYSIGVKEHILFPEVNANAVKGIRSFQVTLVTSGSNKEHSKALLVQLGVPFKKAEK